MNCLIPLDTASAQGNAPGGSMGSSYVVSQAIPLGAASVTFDLTSYNFVGPPRNIIPTIVRSAGIETSILPSPEAWTATSFTCDLSTPAPDNTYVCVIQIYP